MTQIKEYGEGEDIASWVSVSGSLLGIQFREAKPIVM